MGQSYAIRTVVFQSGERFPVLLSRDSGIPLFAPTIFAIGEIRTRNRASATIEQVLRALSVFYQFTDFFDIDLEERMAEGKLLELGEIEALARYCRLPLEVITGRSDQRYRGHGGG